MERAKRLVLGEEEVKIAGTGEDGVNQIRALLGLHTFVTNVNLPNTGQITNLPLGAIVETNAVFTGDSVTPVMSGAIPYTVSSLVSRVCYEQLALQEAIAHRRLDEIFAVFCMDPLVSCSMKKAKMLFDEMVENTKEYLGMYR